MGADFAMTIPIASATKEAIFILPDSFTQAGPSTSGFVLNWPTTSTWTASFAAASFGGLLSANGTIHFNLGGFLFNSMNLFNNQVRVENDSGSIGSAYTLIDQPYYVATGAGVTMIQHDGIRSQPRFGRTGGNTLAVTIVRNFLAITTAEAGATITNRVGLDIIGAGFSSAGVVVNQYGIRIPDLTYATNNYGIESLMTSGVTNELIRHTGTARSSFGGDIHMNNGVDLVLGSFGSSGAFLQRPAAGTLRMGGQGGTNNETLDWDFDSFANNISITSPSGASLNFDTIEIAFGPSTVADGTNNWVFAFAPGLRGTNLAGDYSEVLFSSASAITVAHAINNFATWTINAPSVAISGGSIVNAANVLVQTSMSVGTNRYGMLITSNPSGGTLNYALRVTGSAGVRVDGVFEHTGTNLGFYGITPITQRADIVALTDGTGGTANNALVAISGSGDDVNINNNFADLTAKVNALRDELRAYGLMA